MRTKCYFLFQFVIASLIQKIGCNNNERDAQLFLNKANEELERMNAKITISSWNFETNISDENQLKSLKDSEEYAAFRKRQSRECLSFNWTNFKSLTQRQFKWFSFLGTDALDGEDLANFCNLTATMKSIYSRAKVIHGDKHLSLDPDLTELMRVSTDWNELLSIWLKWRDAAGKPIRKLYRKFFKLGNKAAKLNVEHDLKTLSDIWLFGWESSAFTADVDQLWRTIRPIYQHLHAYVRMRLRKHYNSAQYKWPNDRTIPAHILGNMWAQEWPNVLKLIDPYPEMAALDVTDELRRQNYSVIKMFELGDKFFADLGLLPLTRIFWKESVFENPNNEREMVCHASAWDMHERDDFRIKMCTKVNMKDLLTIHHELGHIQYYMQYRSQPPIFRDGANPGFHEAIGDLLSLSVSTPKHLQKISLLQNLDQTDPQLNEKILIKHQLKMALTDVTVIPWSYLVDLWRWRIFNGDVHYRDANRFWWQLRLELQGVSPPVNRSESDFDAGAKFHVPSNVEYIRYFFASILKFSLHKTLCQIADPGVPLYKCDIDGSKEAGNKLAELLKIGSSLHWTEQLKQITGSETLSANCLIEYYEPLMKFLTQELNAANETIGWDVNVESYGFSNSSLLKLKKKLKSKSIIDLSDYEFEEEDANEYD